MVSGTVVPWGRVPLDGVCRSASGRLAALPPVTREALAAVAALSHPSPAVATRLAGDDDALGPALAEHILALDGDVLRFAHPLLAAAA